MTDRDLNKLYPPFREIVEKIQADLDAYAKVHMIGCKWIVTEGFRTAKRQNDLFQQGRTKPGNIVTQKDGYKRISNHQTSLAVDFAPQYGSRIDWNTPHWKYLGHLARKYGMTWGGDWKGFVDAPHIEWPTRDKTTYRKAREWQKRQGLR